MKSINTSTLKLTKYLTAIILGVILSTDLLFSQPVWPTSWMYRKPVIITGTGTPLTDFQVKVELNASNFEFVKAQSNGGDIRFTDDDGSTLLSYWIEEWASPVSATIWVRVPNIPEEEKIIYLHYGVPRGPGFGGLTPAVSTASGTSTFLFFDDFETGTIDPARWTAIGGPSISVVDYNGNQVASFTGPGAPDGHNRYLKSNTSFGDFILEMRVNMTTDANDDCTPEVGFRITDNDNRYITMLRGAGLVGGGGPDGDLRLARIEGGVQTIPATFAAYDYTANQVYDYRITAGGTEISAWLDDAQVGTTWSDAGSLITSGAISLTNYGGTVTHPVYFDNVRVRTYSVTEPVTTLIFSEYKVWMGGSTNWNLATGWSPYGVPAAGDIVTIPSGASPYITGTPFPVNIFTECADLTVGSASTLTVRPSGDLTVHGNLLISGTLQVSSSDAEDGGSLIVEGSSTGTINFYRAFRSGRRLGDRHYFSSPVGGMTISTFITYNTAKIAQVGGVYQIWRYQEMDGTWPLVTTGGFENGRGYNLDLAGDMTDSVMRFRGTYVKTAAVTATSPYASGYTARANSFDYGLGNTNPAIWTTGRSWTNYGGGGWNLLGNPFTSAMDAAVFISENNGKFDPWYQALYLYDGENNTYRYAASTVPGWVEPFYEEGGLFGDMIQSGQGFFVLALYDGIVFNFNSATMQKHALPEMILLKSGGTGASWPGIKLIAASGGKERSTIVAYNDDMTAGLDTGYDVALLSANPDVEIYTSLMQKDNDVNFARQVLPLAGCENFVIPVGIDTEKGGEVIFSAFTIPLEGYKFWLEDRTAGMFTEISTKSYTVSLPPKTYGTGRFFIIASTNTPTGVENPVPDETGLRIWTSNGQVIISGAVSERAFCEIYDMQGRKIGERQLEDGDLNTVGLPSSLHGVFIVRVVDGLKVKTRKVVIL